MANPLSFAMVNHIPDDLGIPCVSLTYGDLVLVRKSKGYEATQLVAAFICIISISWHSYEEAGEFSGTTIASSRTKGWPSIEKEKLTDYEPATLKELITQIRNALSHGKFEFVSSSAGEEITGLRLQTNTKESDYQARHWGAEIRIDDLDEFLRCYVAQIKKIDSHKRR